MQGLFETIIVGVDDSEPSRAAVTYAARLARDHGGRLLFCSAVNWIPILSETASAGAYVAMDVIVESLQAEADAVLDAAVTEAKRFGVTAERYAPEGRPADEILRLAGERSASLVVLGTHGRRGAARLFLGSTAEAVLRASHVPVLTLRARPAGDENRRCLQRILVGIDDSEPAQAALSTIFDWPADDRRDVVLCTGYEVPATLDYAPASAQLKWSAADARLAITHSAHRAHEHGVDVRTLVVQADPVEAVIAAAAAEHADLVVVGSHGRTGLRRLFLGSVAEGIVRQAPVPVLVVRTAVTSAREATRPLPLLQSSPQPG